MWIVDLNSLDRALGFWQSLYGEAGDAWRHWRERTGRPPCRFLSQGPRLVAVVDTPDGVDPEAWERLLKGCGARPENRDGPRCAPPAST